MSENYEPENGVHYGSGGAMRRDNCLGTPAPSLVSFLLAFVSGGTICTYEAVDEVIEDHEGEDGKLNVDLGLVTDMTGALLSGAWEGLSPVAREVAEFLTLHGAIGIEMLLNMVAHTLFSGIDSVIRDENLSSPDPVFLPPTAVNPTVWTASISSYHAASAGVWFLGDAPTVQASPTADDVWDGFNTYQLVGIGPGASVWQVMM